MDIISLRPNHIKSAKGNSSVFVPKSRGVQGQESAGTFSEQVGLSFGLKNRSYHSFREGSGGKFMYDSMPPSRYASMKMYSYLSICL